jgi:hypothetical protein
MLLKEFALVTAEKAAPQMQCVARKEGTGWSANSSGPVMIYSYLFIDISIRIGFGPKRISDSFPL